MLNDLLILQVKSSSIFFEAINILTFVFWLIASVEPEFYMNSNFCCLFGVYGLLSDAEIIEF